MIAGVKYIQVGIGKYGKVCYSSATAYFVGKVLHHRGVSQFAVNKVVAHFRKCTVIRQSVLS